MFSGCTSLSGNDFTMIMLLLHQGITNLTKMFYNCISANAVIKYDLFRHCPNAINISSFAEGAGIRGGIYSRTDDYDVNDTTTYGTFDFIRDVRSISNAFCNSSIEFLDTNIFAPYDGTYFGIQDADSVFASCRNLKSYGKASRTEMIEEGNLKSKTFFTNLRAIGNFPSQMFAGCTGVDMDIETLQIGDITYDYLFHWPTEINIRTINAYIYSGINLIGTIHNNVFGGKLISDGEYSIVDYTVIDGPFALSGGNIYCDLSTMEDMFENRKTTILQAKNVLAGLKFTNSTIPLGIFEGCTKLNNISKFFSNSNITNNGNVFKFPREEMFRDCTSLNNVSFLFENAYNLSIEL
jgi:hypothetical protein